MSRPVTIAYMVPWLNSAKAGYGTFLGLSLARNLPEEDCRVVLVGGYDSAFVGVSKTYSSTLGLVAIRRLSSLLQVPKLGRAFGSLAKRTLSAIFRSLGVDVVLTNRDYPGLLSAVKASGSRLLLWSMDDPMNLRADWLELARDADHLWTHSYGSVSLYEEQGVTNVDWLPLAFDQESFKVPQVRGMKYPLVFVGNNLRDRETGFRSVIEPMARRYGSDFHIYGRGWPRSHGYALHGELPRGELSRVYRECGIAVGAHRDLQRKTDCSLNLRVFEALGLGACFLSDNVRGMDRLFQPGHDLIVAADPIEMVELADYYLEEEDERRTIANNGRAEVLKNHTMRERTDVIWGVIDRLT